MLWSDNYALTDLNTTYPYKHKGNHHKGNHHKGNHHKGNHHKCNSIPLWLPCYLMVRELQSMHIDLKLLQNTVCM